MRKQYTEAELSKKWDKAAWGYGDKKHFVWCEVKSPKDYTIATFDWDELVALSKAPYVVKIRPVTPERLKQIMERDNR